MPTQAQRAWGHDSAPAARIERANVEPAPAVERAVRQVLAPQPPNACAWCRRIAVPCRHVPGAPIERHRPAYGDAVRSHRRHSSGQEE